MTINATYKGEPGTFQQDQPYELVFGVSAAGYTVKYGALKPRVYKTLRAFSQEWNIIAPTNQNKPTPDIKIS